jgi:DNA uptake protein ComE-like DNA-binding protein
MKWFLAGLGIGVSLGMMMAPARGEESRRRLRDTATRAWDDVSDEARTTLDEMRSSDWARQARDTANQARERVSTMAGNVRQQAPEGVKQAIDRVASATGVQTASPERATQRGAPGQIAGQAQQVGRGNGQSRASLLELLNEASQEELISVNGIGPVLALRIVQHRPYRTEAQPLDDNVIPPSAYEALRDHLKSA